MPCQIGGIDIHGGSQIYDFRSRKKSACRISCSTLLGRRVKSGQSIAEKVGKETKGVALVVVAGMNYAAYVEARGYNVLSSAEHLAERELPRMLEKLITNIKRAAE